MSRVKEYKKYLKKIEKIIEELKTIDYALCANESSNSLFKARKHLYEVNNHLWYRINDEQTKL